MVDLAFKKFPYSSRKQIPIPKDWESSNMAASKLHLMWRSPCDSAIVRKWWILMVWWSSNMFPFWQLLHNKRISHGRRCVSTSSLSFELHKSGWLSYKRLHIKSWKISLISYFCSTRFHKSATCQMSLAWSHARKRCHSFSIWVTMNTT